MKGVRVDPARRTRRRPGRPARGTSFDHETQAFGLATTGGLVSTTGVAGFTLGGGIGWLVRKQGLAVRPPDRRRRRHRRRAPRPRRRARRGPRAAVGPAGGGGNFGIVTVAGVRSCSRSARSSTAAPVVLRGRPRRARSLRFFARLDGRRAARRADAARQPDDRAARAVPARGVHGKPIVAVVGLLRRRRRRRTARRRRAAPRARRPRRRPAAARSPTSRCRGCSTRCSGSGARNHMKAGYLADLGDARDRRSSPAAAAKPAPQCELHVHHMGGAVARVGRRRLGVPAPRRALRLNLISRWAGPRAGRRADRPGAATCTPRSRSTRPAAPTSTSSTTRAPTASGAAYGEEALRAAAGAQGRYDPDNVFHRNQNIRPG